jgi:hypothetical protein
MAVVVLAGQSRRCRHPDNRGISAREEQCFARQESTRANVEQIKTEGCRTEIGHRGHGFAIPEASIFLLSASRRVLMGASTVQSAAAQGQLDALMSG